MSSPLLLNGHTDFRDDTPALRREIERLVRELRRTEGELEQAQSEARVQAAAITSLRRQLSPLYRALQGVFGELEQFGEAPANLQPNSKWDSIKQRLAPRLQEAIGILLVQRSMKRTQLAAAMKMDYSNCTKNVIAVLLRQGLMVEHGRELSLKSLE